MPWMSNRRSGLSVYPVDVQLLKQRGAVSSTNWKSEVFDVIANFTAGPCLVIQNEPVHQPHELKFAWVYRLRLTVNPRTVTLECLALPVQWKIKLTADHLFALSNPALTSPLSEKSFSTVSRRFSPPSSRCR